LEELGHRRHVLEGHVSFFLFSFFITVFIAFITLQGVFTMAIHRCIWCTFPLSYSLSPPSPPPFPTAFGGFHYTEKI
jgi:hypothetical protein